MITNVPNWEDLRTISLQLYFRAWASAVEIITEFGKVYPEGDDWQEEWEGYIRASQADLQTIYTLIQQSQEIGIKALIARVSPYLLLKRNDARAIAGATYDFTDFPTIDASELIRVHNTFCDTVLPEAFATEYDRVRRERNKIAHLGIFQKTITPEELIALLLRQFQALYVGRAWLVDRVHFASKTRWADFGTYDSWSAVGATFYEMWEITPYLTNKQFSVVFGVPKKHRKLVCPDCGMALERMMDGNEPYAPDFPTAYKTKQDQMKCAACAKAFSLEGKKCRREGCKGEQAAESSEGTVHCVTCLDEHI